ncbi:MAG: M14 family zinc carboxypeptidase, partial [Acidobacteriota bacterium]
MIRPRGGSRGALRGTGETMHRFISLFLVAMTGVSGAAAGEWPVPDAGPDAIEPGSVERIREYTTAPEFLSPAVAYVPAVAGVPSPAQVLGHVIGAPGVLSRTADVHGYFDRLAAASPRVATFEILRTEEARPVRVAVIGSAANLKRLASIQQAMWDLADPRRGDAAAVREMLRGLPVVYHLNGGLHSTEVGSPEMLMELGHRLATSEKESIRKIRDNVLVVINPVSEPDGRDKMVDWFERYLRGQVNHDDMPPRSPPYWGKYVFHDNNRDAIQATTAVTEAALDVFFRFHPVVMLDLHESVPFLYISTGTGPYNESIDPVTISEWQQMANYEIGQVTAAGMPGAWTWGFFDGWSPNYLIWIANTHNAIGRFYETFGNGSAETMERTLDPERDRYSDTPVTERTWYRPLPPSATVTWSLRDNTNYMETGVLAALEFAAAHRVELLTHYVEKGERAVRRGRDGSPHAWLVPLEQDDPWRTGLLLFTLSNQGVEIHRLSRPFTAGGRVFPAGTAVVRLDQPYGPLAQGLLSRQAFPADGPRPYDDVSWSLPLHYGVEAIAVDDPLILDAPMERLDGADIPYEGAVHGEGPLLVMPDRGQEGVFQAVEAFEGPGLHPAHAM